MTTARLLPAAGAAFYNLQGKPLAGGKLKFYLTGTQTYGPVYTDAAGDARAINPVVLPEDGKINIWLDSTAAYDLYVYDEEDNLLWNKTNVTGIQGVDLSSNHTSVTAAATGVVSNTLPSGAVVTTWTTSASTNLQVTATNNGTLNIKNLTLSNDFKPYYGSLGFGFTEGYGIADNNGNYLMKFSGLSNTTGASSTVVVGMDPGSSVLGVSRGYIYGNSSTKKLRLKAKGSGKVIINGYSFPNSNGTAGQKLTTNGSKVLSWT